MHEILTIQLGHRANHICTHFWNVQESYFTYSADSSSPIDHDVHFRAGLSPSGDETYTPRTLIYDLKGGFGSLRRSGGLYEENQSSGDGGTQQGVWSGTPVVQQNLPIPQHPYQQSLDAGLPAPTIQTSTVRTWADYSRVFYHPRSIVQINDYELASSLLPFERWESGEELFRSSDREEGLMDRDVRRWIEECDFMQGVQVVVGADDAWGGFGKGMIDGLRDEIGKGSIWVWGVEEERGSGTRAQQLLRTLNTARTIHELSPQVSMYIPLSRPAQLPHYIHLQRSSQWHTSALLSMALESMTLPSRLQPSQTKRGFLHDLESALNVNGNQLVAHLECKVLDASKTTGSAAALPGGRNDERVPGSNTSNAVGEDGPHVAHASFDVDLSGGDTTDPAHGSAHDRAKEHTFARVESLRDERRIGQEAEVNGEEDGLVRKRKRLAGAAVVEGYRSSLQYPLLDSFPAIFSIPPSADHTLPVSTGLSTTSRTSRRIRSLERIVSRMAAFDEREALANGLGDIAEAYDEGWKGGSEGDSDE